uniref:DH domain-containing protein n=1 Tax=Kalmanozyma brasiliensis (strain GHG001) TaxID=1365824 RepID=V5E6D2_KALBG
MLSDALKARYEEQWPLVRSLADVFMKHSHILQNYASYVCHLQRAMEELEEAALMERAFRGKRLKKERLSNTVGLGRTVAALEACAAEQGYAGLMIFVSMPFQRLLKYPLLFQNLLFHTDPSTHEFESTVSMVVEVERLVRSIEDEKVNAEERDNTRDAFARIDGITDRQVLRPRPDRVLIEEKALYDERARRTLSESAPADDAAASDSELVVSGTESTDQRGKRWRSSKQLDLRATLRDKRSYRRLSDFLSSDDAASSATKAPAIGSKKDLWLVRFSDVELKCQRIGVTALPMVSSAVLRDGDQAVEREANDLAARSKEGRERLKALRSTTLRAKTRNLYKFISVVAWRNAAARSVVEDPQGIDGLPTSHEVDEEDDDDDAASMSSAGDSSASGIGSSGSSDGVGGQAGSDKYIRSTKLSFTYWGDRVEPGRAVAGQQPNTNFY